MGHTQGLCRKKCQIHGKANIGKNNTAAEGPQTKARNTVIEGHQAKSGNKERAQWIAKPNGDAHQNEVTPKHILQKPEAGVDDSTKQAFLRAGLISNVENGTSTDKSPTSVGTQNKDRPEEYSSREEHHNMQEDELGLKVTYKIACKIWWERSYI